MADRFPTNICIGGKMRRALLPRFIEVINHEGVQPDWGGPTLRLSSEIELLECRSTEGLLYFCHEEQPWGRFDGLEDFLVKHRIPFDRHHDPRYEYCGETVQFRPGMKTPLVSQADCNGLILLDASDVLKVRDLLRSDSSKANVQKAFRKLDELCKPIDVEPLLRFEILA